MKLFALAIAMFCLTSGLAQTAENQDSVYQKFVTPPAAAKPRVWWHWMNGNITKEGIRKDLLWMHQSGIGGFQNFDASLMTPQIVEKRLTYMTPEWKEAFRYTTKLADSLKLEMAIAGSPGWSETGGPWVAPEDGMKKLVWTEVRVKGGSTTVKVPAQQGITGPFQNISFQEGFGGAADHSKLPIFYRDITVVAFKLPPADKSLTELQAVITSSGGNFTLSQLTDGDLAATSLLPSDREKGFAWIQFAFPKPQTIKAVSMMGGGDRGPFGLKGEFKDTRAIEVSDDGVTFRFVSFIPAGNVLQRTINIPETTGKFFRVTVKNPPPEFNAFAAMAGGPATPVTPPGTEITELVLHPATRIQIFEEKSAFAPALNLAKQITPSTGDVTSQSDVIDLTSKLKTDGTLAWTAPPGEWKVIRFGYSLMGIHNHPASPEATGPEVDKLDPVAIRRYFSNYLAQYKSATGGLMGRKGGLQFMVTDSWEAGAQNWTADLLDEFQYRRGYSMIPWMPVLTGHIIKSSEASEQFLFDFRKTLADMLVQYHYDDLTSILAEQGMKRYTESHESGRALIADGMDVKRKAAIPMSAMWTPSIFMNQNNLTHYTADIRESASVAHIYGQNIAAAESLTALGMGNTAWSYSPGNLKPTADLELAHGLNRFVIHTSVHQPVDDKVPGLGLGPFGQWFNRHETWAGQAKAWTDYLSRSSYLLQQGKFVADIVYYYGEDSNITALFADKLPEIPVGYNFDFINADALINLLSVKDGKLITPSGMRYELIVIDSNAVRMSLPVLRKLNQLAKAGATICGVKPTSTPSLSDDQAEFTRLVNETWATDNTKVTSGKSMATVLKDLNIAPDFAYNKPQADSEVLFVHRTTSDRDIYWVNNRTNRSEVIEAKFRVAGKVPVIWHPETALTEAISYTITNGITTVSLALHPQDAVFVVFKDSSTTTTVSLPEKASKEIATLSGPWQVAFQEKRGAPTSITINELASLSNQSDTGVKYFSGTATYTKAVKAQKPWLTKDKELWLDLGNVGDLAEVFINGKSFGISWKQPFLVNVTGAFQKGDNKIEIKVTNLWVNRLIGDAQPGATKITYTTMPFYPANAPLLPSGLIGPVKLIQK
jgi:hypothetical protein